MRNVGVCFCRTESSPVMLPSYSSTWGSPWGWSGRESPGAWQGRVGQPGPPQCPARSSRELRQPQPRAPPWGWAWPGQDVGPSSAGPMAGLGGWRPATASLEQGMGAPGGLQGVLGHPGRWTGTVRSITALRTMIFSLHQFSIFKGCWSFFLLETFFLLVTFWMLSSQNKHWPFKIFCQGCLYNLSSLSWIKTLFISMFEIIFLFSDYMWNAIYLNTL